jgi:outer membrane protein assembly factor BamE (lipoprotein component of BamABCDE complex)
MGGEFTGLDRGKRRPAKKGGFDTIAIVLGLVVVASVVVGGGFAVWLTVTTPPIKQEPIPTREEFRKRLLGMTTNQVLQAIGKPAHAGEATGENLRVWWLYNRGMTIDPVSQTADSTLSVYFERGKVVEVRY